MPQMRGIVTICIAPACPFIAGQAAPPSGLYHAKCVELVALGIAEIARVESVAVLIRLAARAWRAFVAAALGQRTFVNADTGIAWGRARGVQYVSNPGGAV